MKKINQMLRRLSTLMASIAITLVTLSPFAASAETQLIMVEEAGCVWCERWNLEIGPVYPKTSEGKIAPLRRIDIGDNLPADLTFAAPLYYTPTFVLMRDGVEADRIEGYPGEDFFWGLLAVMIERSGAHN